MIKKIGIVVSFCNLLHAIDIGNIEPADLRYAKVYIQDKNDSCWLGDLVFTRNNKKINLCNLFAHFMHELQEQRKIQNVLQNRINTLEADIKQKELIHKQEQGQSVKRLIKKTVKKYNTGQLSDAFSLAQEITTLSHVTPEDRAIIHHIIGSIYAIGCQTTAINYRNALVHFAQALECRPISPGVQGQAYLAIAYIYTLGGYGINRNMQRALKYIKAAVISSKDKRICSHAYALINKIKSIIKGTL